MSGTTKRWRKLSPAFAIRSNREAVAAKVEKKAPRGAFFRHERRLF
jgi:hypothetical protein